MKITIYYKRNYIPFDLYIHSLIYILKKRQYTIEHIFDVNKISVDTDYLILFMNDLNDIYHINNRKIILIHADYILNHSPQFQQEFLHYVKYIHPDPIYIWEYNTLNLKYYKTQKLENINCSYIPLLYTPYLEDIYNSHITNKIKFEDKPIDVLYMGSRSDRREPILNALSQKFKFYFMENINDISTYMNIINNSKIIVHIYSKESNKSFDYYRSALLYSNKILYLNEESENTATDIDLTGLNNVIYKCYYNNIINKLSEILNQSDEEREKIINNSYIEFKKLNMETLVLDFFDKSIS
jgi:hypothetical protein